MTFVKTISYQLSLPPEKGVRTFVSMKVKTTIAIIGNHQNKGSEATALLKKEGHRLLLFDCGIPLADENKSDSRDEEIEIIQCAAEASWEADYIVLDVSEQELESVCQKIRPYVTMKTVVAFGAEVISGKIPEWLPDSRVMNLPDSAPATEILKQLNF